MAWRTERSGLHGFTLLEMLVVLALVSLITGLLMGAMHQVYQLQLRLEERDGGEQRQGLALRWLRGIVNGLQTDQNDKPNAFRGNWSGFSGLTTAPLAADSYGMVIPFRLEIVDDRSGDVARLEYVQGGKRLTLLEVPGGRLRFDYLDASGTAQSEWPPRGTPPQLPALIRLELTGGQGRQVFMARPESADRPMPSVQRLFSGRGPS